MAEIHFYDQTLRDGQQSLWGMKMRAAQILPVASVIDQTGFLGVEITGTTMHTVLVREFTENPYEGLDLIKSKMPNTHLRAGLRPDTAGFILQPFSVIDLSAKVCMDHGVDSFWIFDCLFELDRMKRLVNNLGDAGVEAVPTASYAVSEYHTDEFFAEKVRAFASWKGTSAIMLADEAGVLTPERAATLLPALIEAAGDVPIEIHCHNTTGLAPLNYLKAIELGITRIHTCSRPLANGPSLPSTEVMLENIHALGHTSNLDESLLAPVAEHIEFVARREGYALGVPAEFTMKTYTHQMPGGMTGTLKSQLSSHGLLHLFDEVVDEVAMIRAEFGYPVMATPFSQIIGIQAVANVTSGSRYSVILDETVLYLMGRFGLPAGPLDQNVVDKVLGSMRGRELKDWELAQPSLKELRKQYGTHLSDEELFLRIMVPGPAVDAMLAAGPVVTAYPRPGEDPLLSALRAVRDAPTDSVSLRRGTITVELRK